MEKSVMRSWICKFNKQPGGYLTIVAIIFATIITFCLVIQVNGFYQQHANVSDLIKSYQGR
ncbi:hypothetical protein NBRC111893_1301 [Lentilactobacillus kosonis]|uniref:Uncharacterized protein n=1 Tax=Lentilactobacillus kosonis TaxID=2810561 RepID=A0A401FLA3_9LACO|nr:hypothetical protein NBRC111893_1301 [Lentilactobacillus kosonis]